ncbi:hypothetical protein J4558_11955 [Leptolyngbya sp. 15MV]|nr:hypothetical protein J4558_11955 [Leptolyngbya sp. 15MV]
MDQFAAIEVAGHDLADGDRVTVDTLGEVRDERRLARPHLAGDDDEPLRLREAISQIRQCLAVRSALEIELRVGRELEGASGQAIEVVEHRAFLQKS